MLVRRLILVSIAALITISPLSLHLWSINGGIHETNIPMEKDWHLVLKEAAESMDLGNDQDCLTYQDQRVSIFNCHDQTGQVWWQSGKDWKVTEAMSADLNRDHSNELVMVVWRPFKPWPIDIFLPHGGRITEFHDQQGMSCHLIMVGWDGEDYRELWAGSALIDPVSAIRSADLDGDGNQELIALEGKYDSGAKTGELTVWDWSGFGFRLRGRVERPFSEFGIVSVAQNVMIITD